MSKKTKKTKSSNGLITGLIVGGAITGVAGMMLSSEDNRKKTQKIGLQAGKVGLKLAQKLLKKCKDKKKT